jgi:toxin ParE1/3/4
MLVRWTAPAAEDLKRITRHIRKDNPTAARSVAKTIFDAGNSLDTLAQRGREGRIAGTREMVFPGWPYILVYQSRSMRLRSSASTTVRRIGLNRTPKPV